MAKERNERKDRRGDADGHTNPEPGEAGGSQRSRGSRPRGHSEGPDASLSGSDAAEASLGVSRDEDDAEDDEQHV